MNNTPSRYQELWDLIKKDAEKKTPEGVTIAAPISLHKRIIKAIQTRKLRDTGYKFLIAEAGKGFCKLEWKVDGSKITFKLTFSLTDEDL